MIGDRDSAGIAWEIVENVTRPAEGRIGVDDPVLLMQRADEGAEGPSVASALQRAGKAAFFVAMSALDGVDELAAEDFAEHFHR